MHVLITKRLSLITTLPLLLCGPASAQVQGTSVSNHRNLQYGQHQRHVLDLYVPNDSQVPPPLVVWIHGGAWRQGDKGNGGRIRWMTEHGYAVASINYRLSQHAIFPAQIHDCKAAIRWLRAHAEHYGYDAARIGVAGSSAGGHLAALLGTSGQVDELEGKVGGHFQQPSHVNAVCDMWGPTDFLQMDTHAIEGSRLIHDAPNSPESQLVGGPIQYHPDRVARANPITYVDGGDPPFLLIHGDMDRAVPVHQSRLLHESLRRANVPVEYHELKGGEHGGRGFPVEKMNQMVLAFFDKYLRARATSATGVNREPDDAWELVRIFSGQPRLLIVHGYSTSAHWWAFLQRKIDRYMGGPDRRVVEVRLCNKGGTPIARWMNVDTGERSPAWTQRLTPMIQAEEGKRPVIVLCQQSLQWAFGQRGAGIRSADDRPRIQRGAQVINQYAQRILEDGAEAAVIAMHIYKVGMEPEIGNERLALQELMKHKPSGIFAGPDVWTPTSKQHPLAFDTDKRHPNFIGAEIMAHYWFASLLEREGLEVPAWSQAEMEAAIRDRPMGLTRDREAFRRKLAEWKIVGQRSLPREESASTR